MCDTCDYEAALEEIDEMLDDERFEFAEDTLTGIKDWVKHKEHITPKQWEAVNNIRKGGERRDV